MEPVARLLVVADLLPPGAGEACRDALDLRARRGDDLASVRLVDAASVRGGLLVPEADETCLLASDLPGLQAQGEGGWTVEPEGEAGRALLAAGVLLDGGGAVVWPGRLGTELTPEAVTGALAAYADAVAAVGLEQPVLPVRLRGPVAARPRLRRAALDAIDRLRRRGLPLRVGPVELPPEVDLPAVGDLLVALLRLHLEGHEPTLRVPATGEAWMDAAAHVFAGDPVTPERVTRLAEAWAALPDADAARARLRRLLDEAPRTAALRALRDVPSKRREAGDASPVPRAAGVLGPASTWQDAAARFSQAFRPTMFMVPTWQCELRCTYCTIPKQAGREMTPATAERAVDLLLSSHAEALTLHFFGGEPMENWPVVQHAIAYGLEQAGQLGRDLDFRITTNGFSLDEARLDWLASRPVAFQLSLDGDAEVQHLQRPGREPGWDSYAHSPATHARAVLDRGFAVDAIMVVSEKAVDRLVDSFFHLAGLGFRRIQLNYAMGRIWSPEGSAAFGRELFRLGLELQRRWADGSCEALLVNLGESLREVRTNDHVTVDWDGHVYGSTSFLYTPALAKGNLLGHLDEGHGFDHYAFGSYDKDHVTRFSFREKVVKNNTDVGSAMTTFVRWMRDQGWTGPQVVGG
ncbi:MAG: radical SAM protein [Alphaproteobacteria bacterium]|nr:radical SAM protein [Alphaproteobacteria bacterium]